MSKSRSINLWLSIHGIYKVIKVIAFFGYGIIHDTAWVKYYCVGVGTDIKVECDYVMSDI